MKPADYPIIRARYNAGESAHEISADYNVSIPAILAVVAKGT